MGEVGGWMRFEKGPHCCGRWVNKVCTSCLVAQLCDIIWGRCWVCRLQYTCIGKQQIVQARNNANCQHCVDPPDKEHAIFLVCNMGVCYVHQCCCQQHADGECDVGGGDGHKWNQLKSRHINDQCIRSHGALVVCFVYCMWIRRRLAGDIVPSPGPLPIQFF